MAWTFDTQVLIDGERNHVVKVVGTSDDTAADDSVIAVDKSALASAGLAVARLAVEKIEYAGNVSLAIAFDHTADDEIANVGPGEFCLDWSKAGGVNDPGSAGGTGDITITTVGTEAGDVFTATLYCRKKV